MPLSLRIIPCLDVENKRVVKGINFQNLKDAGDPVELAARYSQNGADEITFLDISASKNNEKTMIEVVKETANEVFIPLTVGGGIRSVNDVDRLLRAGADKVSVNTSAINNPELISYFTCIDWIYTRFYYYMFQPFSYEKPQLLDLEKLEQKALEHNFIKKIGSYSEGKTLILITHKMSLLQLATRVIVLDQGRIIADGPKDSILEAINGGKLKSIA